MTPAIVSVLAFLGGYLIGSIPFGYLIARWRGVDIFHTGSGNIGATNVGRVLGRRLGILVFVLDFAKGAAPVFLAAWIKARLFADEDSPYLILLEPGAGLCAFLGHLFPVWLRFRGGKGVATGAGVVAVLVPIPALGALLIWALVVLATRYVSLASLAAASALCALQVLLAPEPFAGEGLIITLFCLLTAGLVCLRHSANIHRLAQGNESRLKEWPAMSQFAKTLHVLAVGLWFGSSVFFTFVVAPLLFHTFETLGEDPIRPSWFRMIKGDFDKKDDVVNGPKEQGTRAAGHAVGPIFPWYFLLQGGCGLLAVITCLGWTRSHPHEKVHKVRCVVLVLALVTVVVGWPIEQKVSDLRIPRNHAVEAYLQAKGVNRPDPAILQPKEAFVRWHLVSLGLNFGTILLVAVGMALTARLPGEVKSQVAPNGSANFGQLDAVSRQEPVAKASS